MLRRGAGLLVVAAVLACAGQAQAKSPAQCAPGDLVETGLQGQIPMADRLSGRAVKGYTCNLTEVGSYPSTSFANFDTYENCAYYSDTIGLTNAEGGTIVLDVSDPRKPRKTDYLTARATRNAGESLRVNRKRGLLVADRYVVRGIGKLDEPDSPRQLAVYDLTGDCRHPKLVADVIMPSGVGHEGCFQPDGMVYYMASTDTITPIDLSDPAHPRQLSAPNPWGIHGCSTSDDGTRGYFADIGTGRLLIADTSEVQQRKDGAVMKEIASVPTPGNEGQQSTIPLTYGGKPYLLDWSEFTTFLVPCVLEQRESNFGYAQILDISDERKPQVVSKMKTEVMDPKHCGAVTPDRVFVVSDGLTKGDVFPIVGSQVFLYDTHYCSTDRLHDPTIVACSSFGSGVRVYDIRDPRRPTEIAYWNAGTVSLAGTGTLVNAAVARPVIRSDLGQIWVPDAYKGFHVLQFRESVWPFAGREPCPHADYYLEQYDMGYRDCRAERRAAVRLPSAKSCRTGRTLTLRLRGVKDVRVSVRGRRVRVRRSGSRVVLRTPATGRFTLRVVATTPRGKRIVKTRRYRTCVPTGTARPRAATNPQLSAQVIEQIVALCRLAGRQVS
ncbi:MAG TPA: hypothetical protein VFZ89_13420 [Solirubrobacteraceae bacterium]